MKDCYICSNEATKKIIYTDILGKRLEEYRCGSCAETLESNSDNDIHSIIDITKHKKIKNRRTHQIIQMHMGVELKNHYIRNILI